jgi:short-subunit dehydrogenase
MCYQLSKMGAKVILTARNEQKMEEVRSKLANPDDARYVP